MRMSFLIAPCFLLEWMRYGTRRGKGAKGKWSKGPQGKGQRGKGAKDEVLVRQSSTHITASCSLTSFAAYY